MGRRAAILDTANLALAQASASALDQDRVWIEYASGSSKSGLCRNRLTGPQPEHLLVAFSVDANVVPAGVQRLRYFGYLANCHRTVKLALCRWLLAAPGGKLPPGLVAGKASSTLATTAESLAVCRHSGLGVMRRIELLPAYRWPLVAPDTS